MALDPKCPCSWSTTTAPWCASSAICCGSSAFRRRRCAGRHRGAGEDERQTLRPRDLRLEHGAYDRLRPVAASARRPADGKDAVHHGNGEIEDRERDRGQESRREQLHRQAVQRPDAEVEDRSRCSPTGMGSGGSLVGFRIGVILENGPDFDQLLEHDLRKTSDLHSFSDARPSIRASRARSDVGRPERSRSAPPQLRGLSPRAICFGVDSPR